MWIKLGNEYLNLDQIVRVRFSKTFRAGQEEWSAEVETLIKGEFQVFTRYRGAEAQALQAMLAPHAKLAGNAEVLGGDAVNAPHAAHALTNTLHDVRVP